MIFAYSVQIYLENALEPPESLKKKILGGQDPSLHRHDLYTLKIQIFMLSLPVYLELPPIPWVHS